jgi:hypothetical protein
VLLSLGFVPLTFRLSLTRLPLRTLAAFLLELGYTLFAVAAIGIGRCVICAAMYLMMRTSRFTGPLSER